MSADGRAAGYDKLRRLIVLLVLLLCWLQYRLWVGEGSLAEVRQLERQIEQQQLQVARLKQRNQVLEAEVRDLKTGLEALEERARVELGMIKKGEVFYQIVEPGPAGAE